MPEIICPDDCSTDLPVVAFDFCNPNAIESEINKIYIAKPDAIDFTDVASPVEWGKRISETNVVPVTNPANTTAVDDLIRPLTVIGDRPAPTAVTKELSNQRTRKIRKDFVVNFTIDEITPENLAFQRQTECGAVIVKAWYSIAGGLMFGGNSGILAELTMDLVLARGTDEIVAITGTLTWKGKFTEEAVINPIAA